MVSDETNEKDVIRKKKENLHSKLILSCEFFILVDNSTKIIQLTIEKLFNN